MSAQMVCVCLFVICLFGYLLLPYSFFREKLFLIINLCHFCWRCAGSAVTVTARGRCGICCLLWCIYMCGAYAGCSRPIWKILPV